MIERARRLVEFGADVLVVLDSITRLGRAFNHFVGSSGRTMSGGVDSSALLEPRSIFGAARNIENGGSLTIIASALIDTGSRMDELIFQEFKGTGNMEVVLSRKLAERRVWPAIDLPVSGTRKEELLMGAEMAHKSALLRRNLIHRDPVQAMQTLLNAMKKYPTNAEFLNSFRDPAPLRRRRARSAAPGARAGSRVSSTPRSSKRHGGCGSAIAATGAGAPRTRRRG